MTTHYSFHIDPTDLEPAYWCNHEHGNRHSIVVAPNVYVTGTPGQVIAWAEHIIAAATEQAATDGHLIVPVPDRWTTGDDGSWLP